MDYVPKIDSCFCLSLELASTLIGCFELAVYGITFAYNYFQQLINYLRTDHGMHSVILTIVESYVEQMGTLFVAAFGAYLIIGTRKKSQEFVLSWIFLKISCVFVTSLMCVYLILPIPELRMYDKHKHTSALMRFFELFIPTVLEMFFLFVVLNYYRTISRGNLEEEEEN